MAEILAFLGILLASLVVALLAAFQLVDFLDAAGEILIVIGCIAVFAAMVAIAFSAGYARARRVQVFNGIAIGLALVAVIAVRATGFVSWVAAHSSNPDRAGNGHAAIAVELLLPMLIVVLVQWGLVRRRWLRASGDEDLTLWPWITTAATELVILNPIGLMVVSTVLQHAASGAVGSLPATTATVGAGVVVVTACIECYIRGRILRRRLAAHPPAMGERAGTTG